MHLPDVIDAPSQTPDDRFSGHPGERELSSPPTAKFHRQRHRGERALDVVAFFLADVADGLGPFLVVYLTATIGWNEARASGALSVLLLGQSLALLPAGAYVDRTRNKRRPVIVAAVAVAILTIITSLTDSLSVVYVTQFLTGVVVSVIPPSIAAISLGLVGRQDLPHRAGRNQALFHAGNLTAVGLSLLLIYLFGNRGPFYVVAGMAICSALGAMLIHEDDIDHDLACGADGLRKGQAHVPVWQLFADRRLLLTMVAFVLFHFANAAMLPLAGEKAAKAHEEVSGYLIQMCVAVAQTSMIPVALIAGRFAPKSRKWPLLIGFAVLPLRGLLFTLSDQASYVLAVQILDGFGAGILEVISVLIIADLTHGTGRFNLAQAALALAVGIGAALSNAMSGLIATAFGLNTAFVVLSAIAGLALIVAWLGVPETSHLADGNNKPNPAELAPVPA